MPRHRQENPPVPVPSRAHRHAAPTRRPVRTVLVRTGLVTCVLAAGVSLPAVMPAFAASTSSGTTATTEARSVVKHKKHHRHARSQPTATATARATARITIRVTPLPAVTPTGTPVAQPTPTPGTDSPSVSASRGVTQSPSASPATSAPVASSSPSATASGPVLTSAAGLTDDQLVDSIGVNIHPNYTDTTYVQNGTNDALLQSILRLGVKRVRLGIQKSPRPFIGTFLDSLRTNGVQTIALTGTPAGYWDTYRTGESAALKAAVQNGFWKNRLSALELPNEWDHNGSGAWTDELRRFDDEYYRTLSGSGTGLPVAAPAMAHPQGYTAFGSGGTGDLANVHPYAGYDIPESPRVLPPWVAASNGMLSGKRMIATELGWHNATNAAKGVSEVQSGSYLLRTLIWNRTHGIDQNYVYELFDEKPEPALKNQEQHFGLVAVTGDPGSRSTWKQREKASYTQLKNLLQRLQDDGSGEPKRIQYSISGAPSDVVAVPLLRADGAMDLAVWRKIALTDQAYTGRTSVTIGFQGAKSVSAYDSVTGTTRTVTSGASSASVDVSGAVTILRIADPK